MVMVRCMLLCMGLCLLWRPSLAQDGAAKASDAPVADAAAAPAAADAPAAPKVIAGMSILGNQEAPKSLVIVPWKSSQIGDAPGLSRLLDDSIAPVDKEVFTRELAYYEIRSNPQ